MTGFRHGVAGRIGAALVTVMAGVLAGCGGSGGAGPEVRPASIGGVSTVEGHPHELDVMVETDGYCKGSQRLPEVASLDLNEHPPDDAMLVAAVRYFPADKGSGCAGVGISIERHLHTTLPVDRLVLHDGHRTSRRLHLVVLSPDKRVNELRLMHAMKKQQATGKH